ncbi:MAG TPA: tyrosine-type recombinase/integrase, partial [Cellvibrionaceae bacterium]|nr:tyrosine-type recombinase/integrase [Cellvibrionaceae bacterium]
DGRLNEVFGHLDINTLRPEWMLQYFEARSSQISAKKELKFLSVLCNWAKARGLMTAPNPTNDIMRHMKINEKRDIYVEDSWFDLVLKHSTPMVRDTLHFTYLCANRPDETAQARFSDIDGDELVIALTKTENKGLAEKRIPITGELKSYIDSQRAKPIRSMFLVSDSEGQQIKINTGKFKREFKLARDAAQVEADDIGVSFVRFQLKDIRAKAGTDLAREYGIEAARLALGHTTQKQTQDYIRSVRKAGANARKSKIGESKIFSGESKSVR